MTPETDNVDNSYYYAKELSKPGKIIFQCLAGSNLYGTNMPGSDIDIRGVFGLSYSELLSLKAAPEVVSVGKSDTVFYSLKKFVSLLSGCNPNIIELMWVPPSKTTIITPSFEKLMSVRNMFITKRAGDTFGAYSFSQIKKATGQNKMINNPEKKERPKREEFTVFIPKHSSREIRYNEPLFPDLTKLSVSGSYGKETYKLYDIPGSDGVFCPMGNIKYTNITQYHEKNYIGILVYSKDAYEQKIKAWERYWTWMRERNENRWKDIDNNTFQYDMKNMAHCVRLLLSCENIYKNGEPLVELTGDNLKRVMSIRNGEHKYDDLMKWIETKDAEVKELHNNSTLPESCDMKKVDNVYLEILDIFNKKP